MSTNTDVVHRSDSDDVGPGRLGVRNHHVQGHVGREQSGAGRSAVNRVRREASKYLWLSLRVIAFLRVADFVEAGAIAPQALCSADRASLVRPSCSPYPSELGARIEVLED